MRRPAVKRNEAWVHGECARTTGGSRSQGSLSSPSDKRNQSSLKNSGLEQANTRSAVHEFQRSAPQDVYSRIEVRSTSMANSNFSRSRPSFTNRQRALREEESESSRVTTMKAALPHLASFRLPTLGSPLRSGDQPLRVTVTQRSDNPLYWSKSPAASKNNSRRALEGAGDTRGPKFVRTHFASSQ